MNGKKKSAENGGAAKPKAKKKAKGKYVGKELKVKLSGGTEYDGLCTCERKINGGEQVFLKLNGAVSRFFNVEDIVK